MARNLKVLHQSMMKICILMLFSCVLKALNDKISHVGYFSIDLKGHQAP